MKIHFIILSLLFATMSNAQNLDHHRWKDRLIVLLSPSLDHPLLQQQLQILKSDKPGLVERKLVIYQYTGKNYKTGLDPSNEKPVLSRLSESFGDPSKGFVFYLIGLDGGIKMKEDQVVPLQKIFNLIDSMPMRRAEISTKKKG